jgi:hypothetical protein
VPCTHQLLPTAEGFDPEAYLGVFHASTTEEELAEGRVALERDLGERAGQLKTLVKQNFDRFIGAGTAIDDIYGKLQRIESAGAGVSSAVLFSAVTEVQGAAKRAFGPLLDRHAKAERIKSVQVGTVAPGSRAAPSSPPGRPAGSGYVPCTVHVLNRTPHDF